MISLARVCAALQACLSAVAISSIYISFLLNYEPSKPKDDSPSPKSKSSSKSKPGKTETPKPLPTPIRRRTTARLVAVLAVAVTFVLDLAHDLSSSGHAQLQSDDIVPPVLLAVAWLLMCFGKHHFSPRLLTLSFASFVLGLPLVVLRTVQLGASAQRVPLAVGSVRSTLEALLFLSCLIPLGVKGPADARSTSEETTPFLAEETGDEDESSPRRAPPSYGTATAGHAGGHSEDDNEDDNDGDDKSSDDGDGYAGYDDDDEDDDDQEDSYSTRLRKNGSWSEYVSSFKIFGPLLIPKNDFKVQGAMLVCVVCLMAGRAFNVLLPRQLAILTGMVFAGQPPYRELLVYFVLLFLEGDSGVRTIAEMAKIPVKQFSYRRLVNAAFSHVMGQAMDFHSERDSAEVMKAIEQGGALSNILDRVLVEICPTILDVLVALVILYTKFGTTTMLCMVVAFYSFLTLEVVTFSWNVENRRTLTKMSREEARVQHQAVQAWQTVSAFNMFSYERYRFGAAVDNHLKAEMKWGVVSEVISGATYGLVPAAFFVLASLVIREIVNGRAQPADFVFLVQYWESLIWPIKWLSHEYRYLMSDLIDAERLLDLLNTTPSIVDRPGATDLVASQVEGRVTFEDVGFSYDDRQQVLHGVNIDAKPGQTIAFVGATGAGKSSLTKLLLRYYDVSSGAIHVDGRDVRDVTQGSLREAIGVVPQNPLLFNASIMENIRYANLAATDEQVHDACRAASIHDKILTFARGYKTRVGENGVKLSGGEVQRVAIARAFLKDSPILILDEATSAVDTETESLIQTALKKLSHRRTVFVVAHRLSTIVAADQILVMHEGTVVERGTHHELLEKRGRYYGLWQRQFEGLEQPSADAPS